MEDRNIIFNEKKKGWRGLISEPYQEGLLDFFLLIMVASQIHSKTPEGKHRAKSTIIEVVQLHLKPSYMDSSKKLGQARESHKREQKEEPSSRQFRTGSGR